MIDKDLQKLDELMSLMTTISKHKTNIDFTKMKNKPIEHKSSIEQAQMDLSKVFKYLTELKIKNERLVMIHQLHVKDAHKVCIDLSCRLQNIKKALIYSENLKKK